MCGDGNAIGKSLTQADFFWVDELAKQEKEEAYERLKAARSSYGT